MVVKSVVQSVISGVVKPVTISMAGYCLEANALFAAMEIEPDSERKKLIDNLIRGLKTDTLWSGKDCYYMMAAHTNDNGEAQINWKNPGTFDLVLVNNPVFEVDRGFTGNGTNQYIRTQYNPSTDAINYALNDASFGLYIRNNIASNTMFDIGVITAFNNNIIINSRDAIDRFYGRVNQNPNDITSGISLNSDSFWIASRLIAANAIYYRNGNLFFNGINISTGIPAKEIYILAYNNDGVAVGFTTRQIAHIYIGVGMTQSNVNNETDRIETFADKVGFGVIS